MAQMNKILAEIKALKWAVLQLGKSGLTVAVADINGIPVCMSAHSAYLIYDDAGLFTAADYKGLMKQAGDCEASNWEDLFEIAVFDEENGVNFVWEDSLQTPAGKLSFIKEIDFKAMESQLATYCSTLTKSDIKQELQAM